MRSLKALLLAGLGLALLAPVGGQAAPYSKIVMCDLGGIPLNRTTTTDLSLFANYTAAGATAIVAPSCDFGGIPLNAVTTTDASLFSTAVGTNTWPIPASGFVDFTLPVPGSCQAGSPCNLAGTLANVSRESVNSPGSGFDNQRGQLTVSVAYTNNTAGCTGPASITPTGALNNLAGGNAIADLAAAINCPVNGSVDVTLYVPAGIESLGTTVGAGTGEVCPGPALCAPGQHLDSITIAVPIGGPPGCDDDGITDPVNGEACDEGAANGTPGSCCDANCQLVTAGTECRADAGVCDVAETCDGASPTCPADGFEADGTVCGAAGGPCDLADTCTGGACTDNGFVSAGTVCLAGSGTCDPDDTCDGASAGCAASFASAGTVCGAAGGPCDLDDTCDGAGSCADNGFVSAGTVCLAGSGTCDPDDTCDGASAGCAANFASAGTVCGAAGGPCDLDDTCDGAGSCADNGFVSAGTVCLAGSGTCDPDDTCDGASAGCAANFAPVTTECRADAGDCDVAENCDGAGSCPADVFEPAGTSCDNGVNEPDADICNAGGICVDPAQTCSNGIQEGTEDCDLGALNGTPGSCCDASCNFVSAGTECRADAGACDVAEACTGASATCPADGFEANGTVCGAAAGPCDQDDTCTNGACTDNGFVSAGTVCLAGSGTCDPDDTCDGASAGCAANFAPVTTECRPDAGACDVAENCDGAGACPADGFEADGTVCGAAGGPCDLADTCTGGACTDNGFVSAGTVCLAGSGTCDPDDTCDGASAGCAANFASAGTVCGAAGGPCDNDDTCDGSGACTDNGFVSAGTVCLAGTGTCDPDDTCDGASAGCSANVASAGTVCLAGTGICDPDDTCDGGGSCQTITASDGTVCSAAGGPCDLDDTCLAGACNDNGFVGAGTLCLAGTGTCDPDDTCDGASAGCAANFASAGTVCGAAGGPCDLDDTCDGAGSCADNGFVSAGTVCLAGTGLCDPDDTCDGASAGCAAFTLPDGAVCSAASDVCDLDDTCLAGACVDNGVVPAGSLGPELLACGDGASGGNCGATTCTGDNITNATAVGGDCAIDDLGTLSYSHTFTVVQGGAYKLWVRLGQDGHQDTPGEDYNCDIDGGQNFTVVSSAMSAGTYGIACAANNNGDYCWTAANNNGTVNLTAGAHTLNCSISGAGGGPGESAGYDGIIVTNDLAYVPNPGEGANAGCATDADMTAGTCPTNWGPNSPGGATPGTTCRNAVDSCDVAEECDGVSPACPADGFATAGTACGDGSDTACTNPDSCDGSGACLANNEAAGTICGAAGGPCDLDDTCDGAGSCADNGFVGAGTVCLAGSGTCDPDDTCDGASAGCAASFASAGTVCGAAADVCDLDDTCDGSGACADNGFVAAGTICRADADGPPPGGLCDAAEACTGAGPSCPADINEPAGTACENGLNEPDADACDATGVCLDPQCGNGAMDAGEQCDDGNLVDGDCCNSACQYESAGSACGSGSDTACDNPDTCNGAGTCLVNNETAGTVCGVAGGPCENDDTCDGSGGCTDNGFVSAGTVCLAGSGICDPDDTCTGSGASCPANFASAGIVCLAAGGPCENDDTCDGSGGCTDNGFVSAGTVCLAGSGICDPDDTCDGASAGCAANFASAGTLCLAGTGFCDPDDTCDGAGSCPIVITPDGTICGAAAGPCDLDDTCNGGACVDNGFAAAGTVCLAAGPGACDVDDTCTGSGASCPSIVASAGTVCRADADGTGCDTQELCDGVADTCPADVCATSGPCDNGSGGSPDTCDASCICNDPVVGGCPTGFTGAWQTPTGTAITDLTNIGAGDTICAVTTTSGTWSGATCTVNGVSGACSYTANSICISAATLTANLFSPTLANCSALTTAASRLRNARVVCNAADTGNVPAAYAMPVTDGTIGGPGNGFADGSIQVCAIDRWTGGNIGQAIGIQVEDDSTPPVILHRATIAAGNTCTTISGGSLTGALTVTAASEGYQTFTVTKADAREFELPMSKRLSRERAEATTANTWYLQGDFLASSYNTVHTNGGRHGGCNNQLSPNPIRGGLAISALYRTSFTGLSLDALLGASVQKNLNICAGALSLSTPLPGNLATPDIMGGTDTVHFEGLRVNRPSNVLVQALGASLSPESMQITALLNGADFDITSFDLIVAGQEMAVVNPLALCPAGGVCNINAAAGGSWDIADMPGYTRNTGASNAVRHQYWAWDWTAANGAEVNVMSQFEQATAGHFGHDPDTFKGAAPNVITTDPQDTDFIRYGATAYFDCGNDPTNGNAIANCYPTSGLNRSWRGFIGRDVDVRYGVPKAEQLSVYGMFIDSGSLVDTLVAFNIYLGARVEGPNTNGGSATSFGPLGGPLQAAAITYINGKQAGSVTSARAGTIGTWFKFEARGSVHINMASTTGGGTCTTAIAPRAGACIVSGWDDDNVIGIPRPVEDGLGNSPYDMGDAASVTQCVASIAPGELCQAFPSGDVRTLGLTNRTFVFDNNSAGLAAPWGDPDLIVHALSVGGGQAFYAGALATTPILECVGGDNNGTACIVAADCPNGGVCSNLADAVSSGDESWVVAGIGPGMAGGAQQSFVLPDLAAACPSCSPLTALTVKDWRHLNNGATPGGFTDQGPGVHALDLDSCTAPGCKTAARGQCIGGTNPGTACTADGTCTGGVCGQTYSGLNWNMFGYGSATMNSCQTANAWHYREINAGGLGGIEEARNFSVNSTDSIFNE